MATGDIPVSRPQEGKTEMCPPLQGVKMASPSSITKLSGGFIWLQTCPQGRKQVGLSPQSSLYSNFSPAWYQHFLENWHFPQK
ncbi:hypothetical protein JZ751_018581 [Albula glossodonta]|uniref:Uncharacterized protein n=1 Tax=Albula glossodonta TaxID=121402 RepID=A0A8T2NZR4_9TELE|nr:hypothetical protein JZ751_018581 [Albula glossodonta]